MAENNVLNPIENCLDEFETKAYNHIIGFFKTYELPIYPFEEEQIKFKAKAYSIGYFEGKPSPHGLGDEARNYAVDICEIIEDILEHKGISIPDPERELEESHGITIEARLYGQVYYKIEDAMASILKEVKEKYM